MIPANLVNTLLSASSVAVTPAQVIGITNAPDANEGSPLVYGVSLDKPSILNQEIDFTVGGV